MLEDILLIEYRSTRQEVIERVKTLHALIALASIILFIAVIAGVFVYSLLPNEVFWIYLLLTPPVFAGITFNYQANQMTLEALAIYSNKLRHEREKNNTSWDNFYTKWKRTVQLTSFLKTVPLYLPLILPFILMNTHSPLLENKLILWLMNGDILLATLVIVNFYYKIFGLFSSKQK